MMVERGLQRVDTLSFLQWNDGHVRQHRFENWCVER